MKKNNIIISLSTANIDLLSKYFIDNLDKTITVIKNIFYIEKTYNTGAAFSIMQGNAAFLIMLNLFILFYLIIGIPKTINKYQIIGYSLLIGGILGNTLNRMINGYIIDFIKIELNNYIFPIFNLADVFIITGIIILGITIIKGDENGNKSKQ